MILKFRILSISIYCLRWIGSEPPAPRRVRHDALKQNKERTLRETVNRYLAEREVSLNVYREY